MSTPNRKKPPTEKRSAQPRRKPLSPTRKSGRRGARQPRGLAPERYAKLEAIDGRHPLAATAPSAIVSYPARRRRDSEIAFFNFDLAREVGLIPARHPDRLSARLRKTLLDTFSLVIVNEWDEAHGKLPSARDRLPHPYMATRYLQLQHPDKCGANSGDGRSIWNGIVRGRNGHWDVSSCGTGVTRLCPATSALGEFFETGNHLTDYGCGTAHIDEGIGAALMSEAFARNGIRTERVLAVLALPSGQAINVRLAPNLLRPSHFFGLLRRRRDEDLERLVLYYAQREIDDGRWPAIKGRRKRISYLAERVARDFARATATFESEYIFCWLDWDGDNILTDGSIIDYGSVRQFGLYHHRYRFEDTDRLSTSIPEQKRKARQIVQRFVQLRELLLEGELPPLASLRHDPTLERFDEEFETHRRRLFLRQIGFDDDVTEALVAERPDCLESLLALHRRLERRRSSRGACRVPDGFSWNAVYCMRDILRELPRRLLEGQVRAQVRAQGEDQDEGNTEQTRRADRGAMRLSPRAFFDIALSAYASRADRRVTPYRKAQARAYQRDYLALVDRAAELLNEARTPVLAAVADRAERRNPYARMTGDGLTHATRQITARRRDLAPEEIFELLRAYADFQQREGPPPSDPLEGQRPLVQRLHRKLRRLTEDFRESL